MTETVDPPPGAGAQSVTTGGLPYPESTAALNQGANDIKALALALEARGGAKLVQVGSQAVTTNAGGNCTITFPTAFAAAPIVMSSVNIPNIVGLTAPSPATTTKQDLAIVGVWPTNPAAPIANTAVTVFYIAIGKAP